MNPQDFDLKKTVNLPKTDFPMQAKLPEAEPKLLDRWNSTGLYNRIREARAGRPMYVLHDGPPYANGNIHLGHAFNKLLKDFIVKSKSMAGFDSPYVPGWDCHGLPIEIKVDNELGSKKAKMTAAEIRQECRKYAQKYVDLQSKDFQRLGVFGRWEDPYLTMSAGYESVIARSFVEFLEKGFIYKGLKPVSWCMRDRTALAEAEVEYENRKDPQVFVRFRLKSGHERLSEKLAGKEVYAVIWTTTPWTLPANLGISFNPKFTYVAYEHDGAYYIIAKELLLNTVTACFPRDLNRVLDHVADHPGQSDSGITAEDYGWAAEFSGAALDRLEFEHPFIDRTSLGMVGMHVTADAGTGAVHTAPGHGQDDYVIGQQYGLPVYCPVDASGRLFQVGGVPGDIPEALLGKTVWEANKIVPELLGKNLLSYSEFDHSYPHCWRCHSPTIFRATEQWFIGMDRNDLRTRALEAIKGVNWMPSWGEERISNMIALRPDWCISRQRVWGVPITVFYCEGCDEALTDSKVLHRVADLFAEHTADVWYERSAEELMGPGITCAKCGGSSFRKETDILDVWFDSGASHLAVLNERNGLPWPSDLYLEGGDQYRGWFHSSLLIGVGLHGGSPYRNCVTNGWTLDGEGRAMSKSLGNVIEPEKIIKQYGAELLRLWVSSVEYSDDVRLSETILKRLTDAYRKLRNTFRFALGNLSDFDPATDSVPINELSEIDHWVLVGAEQLVARCRTAYDEFAFHKIFHSVNEFATTDLSAIYFDILKDRLYTSAPKSNTRRSAQTAIYRLTHALTRLMAPIMAFTMEEIWQYLPKSAEAPDSVHLTLFPEPQELTEGLDEANRKRAEEWQNILPVRDAVLKSLEEARKEKFIGAPLEAKVNLKANSDLYPLLERYGSQLPGIFIVSQVTLENGGGEEVAVKVEKADGEKCQRCWKFTTDVGSDPDLPGVCASCAATLREMTKG